MQRHIRLVCLIVSFLMAIPAQAAFSPISIAVIPPVQFPADDYTITGARFSLLWGRQRHLYGFDIGGIGNITDQEFAGLAVSGIFNLTRGPTKILGLQLAGVTNINQNKTAIYGAQIAPVLNMNTAESSVTGLQLALLGNLAPHTAIYGVQAGLYNKARDVYGLQLGLVNVASSLHGVQIGLLNFNHKGFFAVSPLINIGF